MTIAYWCVFVMILFPYIFTILAKTGSNFDNHNPRQYLHSITGWRKRADYVQLNSFEITPAFGIAVIIAHLTGANQSTIDLLALSFVISRVCYGALYLWDKAALRSLFWGVGVCCIIGLFLIAGTHTSLLAA